MIFFSEFHDLNEKCDFCILNFPTRAERNVHILTHFKKKTCLKTKKLLIYIADEWFELHISPSCTSEECNYEMISNLEHINDQLIKEEENDLDSRCSLNDETNIKYEDEDSGGDMKFENETETNFDSMSTTSSERNVTKFETRARKAKTKVRTPSKAKPTKVTSKTKLKKTLNEAENPSAAKHVKQSTKCRICKQRISQKKLMEHLQLRHVPKTMDIPTCKTCGKTFSTPGNLRHHQHLHADRGRYICSYCGKDFVRNANLKEHINLHTVSLTNFRVLLSELYFSLITSGCTTFRLPNL